MDFPITLGGGKLRDFVGAVTCKRANKPFNGRARLGIVARRLVGGLSMSGDRSTESHVAWIS